MSMSKTVVSVGSYIDQPCDRCGSKKRVTKTKREELSTIFGTTIIEVSQVLCTNNACQALFDKLRAEELVKINERKMNKEIQDKIRKENIANTIKARKKAS